MTKHSRKKRLSLLLLLLAAAAVGAGIVAKRKGTSLLPLSFCKGGKC